MGSLNKEEEGKACILALGKAFPHQIVMQDYLVDGYFKNTNCEDPELKQKLARLCNSLVHNFFCMRYENSGCILIINPLFLYRQDHHSENKICGNVRRDPEHIP